MLKKLWILAAIGLLAWWGYGKFIAYSGQKDAKPKVTVNITAADVKRQDVPLSISLPADVVPLETVSVKSRIDSQIAAVEFKDGDAVKVGQVLFRLDNRALKAQKDALEADVQKEKAQLENLERQYERSRKLVKSNAISRAELDNNRAAYRAQLAALKSTEASLENIAVQLSYCTITSPINGRAGTIHVTLGNNVKANDVQPLVTINRISPIFVQFAIPERYFEQVKGNIPVSAIRQNMQGALAYIDNTIDASTGAFIARAIFQNEKEMLWPGMFVNVRLDLGKDVGALTMPVVAVQGDESQHFVFKVVSNKAVKTPVDIARIQGETAVIAKGVSQNDVVITDGLLRVTDGAMLNVKKP